MAMKSVLLLMVAITLSPSSARVLTQNAVASVLQDILSPDNTGKTLQLIKMAALRSNKKKSIPEMARAVVCNEYPLPGRIIASDYIPARMIASNDYLPAKSVVANEMPVRIIASNGYNSARPELPIQKILKQFPMKQMQPNLMESLVFPKEIFQSFPMPEEIRPCQTIPASNPYLPLASPVSAMSPGRLPPPTQSKGQFLRKIPIPPPTL